MPVAPPRSTDKKSPAAKAKGAAAKPASPSKPSEKPGAPAREVIYPKPAGKLFDHENPLRLDIAKKLLGWHEVADGDSAPFLLTDLNGKKIRCSNNIDNRGFTRGDADRIKQEVLRGNWELNGETIIIGKTGITISCQHRLIGLVLAVQAWYLDKARYPFWKEEPYLVTFASFGVEESDKVVNTIDTGKPRSLTDVIFRSDYFRDLPMKERSLAARLTDGAVKMLWYRTGVELDPFAPKRTHKESLDFIGRHPKILECVKHIQTENGDKAAIAKYLSPGYASAMLYMMGSAKSNAKAYRFADPRREELLDWSLFDKASNFFVELAQGSKKLMPVNEALGNIIQDEVDSSQVRMALIAKAWLAYLNNGKVSDEDLKLEFHTEDGVKSLAEHPVVGGIDRAGTEDDEVVEGEEVNPSEKSAAQPAVNVKAGDLTIGAEVRVKEPDVDEEGVWNGTLDNLYDGPNGKVACVKAAKGFAGAGKIYEVPVQYVFPLKP